MVDFLQFIVFFNHVAPCWKHLHPVLTGIFNVCLQCCYSSLCARAEGNSRTYLYSMKRANKPSSCTTKKEESLNARCVGQIRDGEAMSLCTLVISPVTLCFSCLRVYLFICRPPVWQTQPNLFLTSTHNMTNSQKKGTMQVLLCHPKEHLFSYTVHLKTTHWVWPCCAVKCYNCSVRKRRNYIMKTVRVTEGFHNPPRKNEWQL